MNNPEIENKVKNIIDRIRPALQADGGNIDFIEITKDNVVLVKLLGACGACPYSLITLKQGVEAAIKEEVPEIKAVEAVK
ncbi:MAG: NifU family protein [Bacteroidales bacterium]|nr:NifU family protein [Bacteroidales bacterium]